MQLFRLAGLSALLVITANLLIAGYSPTVTEINLGYIPLDYYLSSTAHGSLPPGDPLPNCPSSYTVRDCYKLLFNNNSSSSPYTGNNFIAQGITGVRFMFGLYGGAYSTAWNSSGIVSSTWVNSLATFLSDLHSYGVARVTPTPILDGSGAFIVPSSPIYDCTGTTPLVFLPAVPYGQLSSNMFPDCQGINNGYNSANSNPYFWGWSPYFNLVNAIFGAVSSAGLSLAEFDLENEINTSQFTVMARLFYDNVHGVDVLSELRSLASSNGLNPYVITASTGGQNPSSSGYDCGSVYGDSAMILNESTLLGTLAGGWSYFGFPYNASVTNNLVCGGAIGPSGGSPSMIQLPVTYATQPTVNDVHETPCVVGSGGCDTSIDATTTAQTFYSDMWSFLYYRSMTGNVAMIGETTENSYCDGQIPAMASQNVAGYEASSLYSNHASGTTLRPWEDEGNSCFAFPVIINPPYTP